MSNPAASHYSTLFRVSLCMAFVTSSIPILCLLYVFPNPWPNSSSGTLGQLLVALSPFLLVIFSLTVHILVSASWEDNPFLNLGLCAFFVGVLNTANYLGIVNFTAWFETSNWTVLGVFEALLFAIFAFLISELLYYGLIYGSENLGAYGIFHNKLRTIVGKTARCALEMVCGAVDALAAMIKFWLTSMFDLVSICFTWEAGHACEDSDPLSIPADNEPSLTSPYWKPITPITASTSNSDFKHDIHISELPEVTFPDGTP